MKPGHPHYGLIEENLRLKEAGIRGEERLLQKLSTLEHKFMILPNVCLELGEEKVQIDCLLFNRNCAIVLESKNISGDL